MKARLTIFSLTLTYHWLATSLYEQELPKIVYSEYGDYVGCDYAYRLVNAHRFFRTDITEEKCRELGARSEDSLTVPFCFFVFETWLSDKTKIPSCIKKQRDKGQPK